jgi:hypothetical protein
MNRDAFLAGYLQKEAIIRGGGHATKQHFTKDYSPAPPVKDIYGNVDEQRSAYLKDKRFGGKTSFEPSDVSMARMVLNAGSDPAELYKLQRQSAAHQVSKHLNDTYGKEKGGRYFKHLQGSKDFMHNTVKDYHKYGRNEKNPKFMKAITDRATPLITSRETKAFMDNPMVKAGVGALGTAAAGYLGVNLMNNVSANRRHKEMMEAIRSNRGGTAGAAPQQSPVFRLSTPAARARQGGS